MLPDIFLRSSQNCKSTNKSNRFKLYESISISLNFVATTSITLNSGYNRILSTIFGPLTEVYPGDFFHITSYGGKLAIDTSGTSPVSDFILRGNKFYKLDPNSNWRFHARVIVSPKDKVVSVYKQYASYGTFTVSSTLSTISLSSSPNMQTQTVIVQQEVSNVNFLTSYGTLTCFKNLMCGLQATVATGSHLIYNWAVSSNQTLTTTVSLFLYRFTNAGTFNITLTVFNNVSTANVTKEMTIIDRMTGLQFFSGNSINSSSSIVSQDANFLFILGSGQNYNCSIDFGDGTWGTVSDYVYDMNNSRVSHIYSVEKVYLVNITCINPINALTQAFNHVVQKAITGLTMLKTGALVNEAYTISYSLLTGSPPYQIYFSINNVSQSINQISNLLFQTSQRSDALATIYQVYFNISNQVSNQEYVGTFQISGAILNPTFSVYPMGDLSTDRYLFPVNLTFSVGMLTGSNVNIFINTDSTGNPSILGNNIIQIQTLGDWYNNVNDNIRKLYNVSYVYPYPGDFTISVNVSNYLGYFILSKTIKLETRVDYLIPNLMDDTQYVVFQSTDGGLTGRGLAQFVFNFVYGTNAGYGAYATFWPGDSQNMSYGHFPINMDFSANISKTSLQYTYANTGTYKVNFFVTNTLGSKYFSMTIYVKYALSGFFIQANPASVMVGNAVNISAYVVQGNNVSYTWAVDGVPQKTSLRTGLFFKNDNINL